MFCNNCGGKGHLFRNCKDPVLSCGIMLLNVPTLPRKYNEIELLMIRRKDSMSYAEFMRGKYEVHDLNYLSVLFRNMTIKEQAALVTEPFDALWKSLWGDDRSSSDYTASREKFAALDRMYLMTSFLSPYTEPEWGFPKGRRMRGESDLACAVREFGEETNIPRAAYTVLKNITLEETFVGLNNVLYRHIYFVALLKQPDLVDLKQKFTPMQRREISGIGWKSFWESDFLIRPHYSERRKMMEQLKGVVEAFEADAVSLHWLDVN